MAHSGRGWKGEIFSAKRRPPRKRVHSLFTLSGSVCPTQPRPRNPPSPFLPPLDQPPPPFLLLVSPPPRPFFCPPTERGVAPDSFSNWTLDIFHRPNREGMRRGRVGVGRSFVRNFCVAESFLAFWKGLVRGFGIC